jgi:hypothetical protein
LAIADISGFFIYHLFAISGQAIWIPIYFLLLFSLNINIFLKWKYWILGTTLLALVLNFYTTNTQQQYFVLCVNVFFLVRFVMFFIRHYLYKSKINLFYILMIISESVTVISLLAVLYEIYSGLNIFFAGMIIQIIIGILLIFTSNNVPQIVEKRELVQ